MYADCLSIYIQSIVRRTWLQKMEWECGYQIKIAPAHRIRERKSGCNRWVWWWMGKGAVSYVSEGDLFK